MSDFIGVVVVALVLFVAVFFLVFGFIEPIGEAAEVWTEVVVDKQYEGSRSASGVGIGSGGQVGIVSTHSSAKYHVITEREIYEVGKSYYMRVQVGDEIRVGKFKTLFKCTVVRPVALGGGR